MPANTNVRGKTYSSSYSNPVESTGKLKGEATTTPADNAKNDTGSAGYVGPGSGPEKNSQGPLGAKPSWK